MVMLRAIVSVRKGEYVWAPIACKSGDLEPLMHLGTGILYRASIDGREFQCNEGYPQGLPSNENDWVNAFKELATVKIEGADSAQGQAVTQDVPAYRQVLIENLEGEQEGIKQVGDYFFVSMANPGKLVKFDINWRSVGEIDFSQYGDHVGGFIMLGGKLYVVVTNTSNGNITLFEVDPETLQYQQLGSASTGAGSQVTPWLTSGDWDSHSFYHLGAMVAPGLGLLVNQDVDFWTRDVIVGTQQPKAANIPNIGAFVAQEPILSLIPGSEADNGAALAKLSDGNWYYLTEGSYNHRVVATRPFIAFMYGEVTGDRFNVGLGWVWPWPSGYGFGVQVMDGNMHAAADKTTGSDISYNGRFYFAHQARGFATNMQKDQWSVAGIGTPHVGSDTVTQYKLQFGIQAWDSAQQHAQGNAYLIMAYPAVPIESVTKTVTVTRTEERTNWLLVLAALLAGVLLGRYI